MSNFDDSSLEFWQERASIREHDGGASTAVAEVEAFFDTIRVFVANGKFKTRMVDIDGTPHISVLFAVTNEFPNMVDQPEHGGCLVRVGLSECFVPYTRSVCVTRSSCPGKIKFHVV